MSDPKNNKSLGPSCIGTDLRIIEENGEADTRVRSREEFLRDLRALLEKDKREREQKQPPPDNGGATP